MLEELRTNITRLIALYEVEKQRADALEVKLLESEEKSRQYKEQIISLNQQIDSLKLAAVLSGQAEKPEAVERINKMIREIDRCIKLLEG